MRTLLDLLAATALLVWGTHIVRGDVLSVFGGDVRRVLVGSGASRSRAFASGLGATALLQSASATTVLATSYATRGPIGAPAALPILLGAGVGAALVALLLSIAPAWLSPLLVLVGVVVYLPRQTSRAGRIGRVLIGLGLILLALALIAHAMQPLAAAAGARAILAALTADASRALALAAVVSVLARSSLVAVLLTAALAAATLIPAHVALALILGANLGSGLLGLLATSRLEPAAKRVAIAGLAIKVAGVLIALPLLPYAEQAPFALSRPSGASPALFHLLFNACLAFLFLGATAPLARLAGRLLPDRDPRAAPSRPRHLDPAALATPALAIGCATRESIRIADAVASMLQGLLQVIQTDDRELVLRIRETDDVVDTLYTEVKLYLTQVSRVALQEHDGRRWTDIVSFIINMEQIGDIIERMVTDLEERKIAKGLHFSEAGLEEICDLHHRLVASMRLGTSVYLERDTRSAQQLLAEKVLFRELERAYADSHLDRLAGNTRPSIETSALHLDLLDAMRRINSHICSVAYPILDEAGLLQPSAAGTHPAREAPPANRAADADGEERPAEWGKEAPRTA